MAVMFRSVLQNAGGAAELVVACASEFAGATISCSDGTTTLNKTCPSSSPYEVVFKIPNSGNWTVSATVSGVTYSSDPVSVLLDYTTDLDFGFNWQTWVDTAQYLDSTDYSTLADLLADEEAVRELCTEHATVDYLCRFTDVNTDLETVINNDIFAKWVNLRDYSLDKMYANEAIADEMDTADKYGYGEWALMPQVPTMTSNTTPYGTSSGSSALQSGSTIYYSYYAFDDNASTTWGKATNDATPYISYIFVNPTIIKKVWIKNYTNGYDSALVKVCARNTGEPWITLNDNVALTTGSGVENTIKLDNTTAYDEYAVFALDKGVNDYWNVASLQFYAWAPKGNVPVMTTNTAPYGQAFGNGSYTDNPPYYCFDSNDSTLGSGIASASTSGAYIGYRFVNPVCAKRVSIKVGYAYSTQCIIQASNDGTTYTPLKEFTIVNTDGLVNVDFENDNYYLYYRIYQKSTTTAHRFGTSTIQFYGREMSVSVPTMTNNTTPYGEVIYSSVHSSTYDAFKAFDGDNTTRWNTSSGTGTNSYIGYKFTSPVCIKRVAIHPYYVSASGAFAKNYMIEASNDGFATKDTLYTGLCTNADAWEIVDLTNTNEYLEYRCFIVDAYTSGISVYTLQFYGFDYSEKEFEEGTTKKWLYDHGLELETLNNIITGGQVLRGTNEITVQGTVSNAYAAIQTDTSIDITPYDVLRMKVTGGVKGGNSAPNFGVNSTKLSADNIVAYSLVFNGNGAIQAPNALGVDVSSVSQTLYVLVASGLNTGSITLNELWLE